MKQAMSKAPKRIETAAVVALALSVCVMQPAVADDRYPGSSDATSIASVFDQLDPAPEANGDLIEASADTSASAGFAQGDDQQVDPYSNWPSMVGADRGGDAVADAGPQPSAVQTVPAGKPYYTGSRPASAGASAPSRPLPPSITAPVFVPKPSAAPSSIPTAAADEVDAPVAQAPAAPAPAAAPKATAAKPAPAPKATAAKPAPAPKATAAKPAPAPKATAAKPAPAPKATASKPAPAPKATASSKPAAPLADPVTASTTESGPIVLADAGDVVAPITGQPAPQRPVMSNPEVDESLVSRGNSGRRTVNIMRVLTGKSLIIDLATDAKRVSVADPAVAEVMIISPRQVMVNGLADGETTIIIWDRRGNYTMYSMVVGDALADQVMLEVTVAEINRTAMERHGIDHRHFGQRWGSVTQFGGVAPVGGQHPPGQGDPLFPISLDGGISWAIVDLKHDLALLFKQIQDENLGRVLAEPKLLARSGKDANFLSGGEIPIVVTSNDDTSIEFKEFGTKIDFTPTVREDGTIDLELKSEVSEPDFSSGVQLFGFTVPAFVTRRTQTDVTLRNGESLIVAGLMKETKQEIESKMPFLGDVPFLGYMFRKTEYTNDVLELVVVVRPRLIKPIEAGRRVALPTDRGPLTREEVRTGAEAEKVSRPRPY